MKWEGALLMGLHYHRPSKETEQLFHGFLRAK